MNQKLSMYRKIHFIAIGGIGMSALARILLEQGYIVSGSDIASNHLTDFLLSRGAEVYTTGQDASHLGDADLVIVSSAIRADNPELRAAKAKGIPVWHRADLLGAILGENAGIGITGTHGKTTSSAMLTTILLHAGLSPTAILGGELPQIGGNSCIGHGPYVVAEVDESDRSFLKLHPRHAIVTNIDLDHMDHYASMEEIVAAFRQYLSQVSAEGYIVLGVDCPQCRSLSASAALRGRNVITCSTGYAAELRGLNLESVDEGMAFDAVWLGDTLGRVQLRVPGVYNVQNALCAMAMAMRLGLSFDTIRDALGEFGGAARRFQQVCAWNGIRVIDEYSHHPTELRAVLNAAKAMQPQRLIAVFQPHLYSRTRIFLEDFALSFMAVDLLVLTDIYGSREDPAPGITGALLFDAVRRLDPQREVHYVADKRLLAEEVVRLLKPGDLVLMLGAGDISQIAVELCALGSASDTFHR